MVNLPQENRVCKINFQCNYKRNTVMQRKGKPGKDAQVTKSNTNLNHGVSLF